MQATKGTLPEHPARDSALLVYRVYLLHKPTLPRLGDIVDLTYRNTNWEAAK